MTQLEASAFFPMFLSFRQCYHRFFIPSTHLTRVTVNDTLTCNALRRKVPILYRIGKKYSASSASRVKKYLAL